MDTPILRWFDTSHLRNDELAIFSQHFEQFAHFLNDTLPAGPETSTALRKLLESKDAAVRAYVGSKE